MSQTRYLKSMITPTLVEPTENHEAGVASGVWSTQDQLEARRGGVWPEAGVANPDTLIENNFATTLYEGNGSTQSITTGIDSVNKDSLVWIKNRDAGDSHVLTDTVKGATKILHSDTDAAEATDADTITAFSSTGFALGDDVKVNTNNESYCAWTFKKAPKFFDVVTYTGNGTAGRTIAHSLGTTVGMLIIKELGNANDWDVLHRSTEVLRLNSTAAPLSGYAPSRFGDGSSLVRPTSSVFTVGSSGEVNGNNQTYVAYLFADNSGEDAADRMIVCGSYTGNGSSTGPVIDLGFEPQWLLTKAAARASDWTIVDNIRGTATGGYDARLHPQSYEAEAFNADIIDFLASGFQTKNTGTLNNGNNETYIYVAIRRPNMATITDATEVFNVLKETSATLNQSYLQQTSFNVDFVINKRFGGASSWWSSSRLINARVQLEVTDGETDAAPTHSFEVNNGVIVTGLSGSSSFSGYHFKRAKGYFDIVAYTGTGSARTVAHGLTVAPEMMWVKNRGVADPWAVYYGDNTDYLVLNTDAATVDNANWWNDTSPTSSVFTVGTDHSVNASGEFYIAYLFATLAGISKVGSVTHSGSSTDVDCGFSAGSRFVLLKRTDATGSWYVWDSVRGIIAGNDPYLLFDTTAAEVTNTDLIDPLASGFQISGDFTDGDYIFYAIA